MFHDPTYIILTLAILGASRLVSWRLRSKFARYSETPLRQSGAEIAERMLREKGVGDVEVLSVRGQLTDHYHPEHRTVNLSEGVYAQRNVAAAAVAAHECGHAVQHATGYPMLQLRSKLVPLVSISSRFVHLVLMAGLVLAGSSGNTIVLLVGCGLFALTTLFSLITLPVEFNASRRALDWLDDSQVLAPEEHAQAKDALWWAAMTYTVAALGSIGQLLYYLQILLRARGHSRRH